MNRLSIYLIFFCLTLGGWAQAQELNFENLQTAEGPSTERLLLLAQDEQDYIYLAYAYEDSILAVGNTQYVLGQSLGQKEYLIQKQDTQGQVIWQGELKSNANFELYGLKTIGQQLYLVGSFSSPLSWVHAGQTDSLAADAHGNTDGFLLQLSTAGQWQRGAALRAKGDLMIRDIAQTAGGDLLLTGGFKDSLNISLGATPQYWRSTPYQGSYSTYDVFVLAYDSSFQYQRGFQLSNQYQDYGQKIEVNSEGDWLLLGSYYGSLDLDPSNSTQSISYSGANGIFVSKYNAQGQYLAGFGLRSSSGGGHILGDIVLSSTDELYICGDLNATTDLDPSAATYSVTGYSGRYAFFAQYDAQLNFVQGHSFGNTSTQAARGILLDNSRHIYLWGYYANNLNISDATGNSEFLAASGGFDLFLARYSAQAELLWAQNWGSNADEIAAASLIRPNGKLYLGGSFSNSINFDPNSSAGLAQSQAGQDAFLLGLTGACQLQIQSNWSPQNIVCVNDSIYLSASGADSIYFQPHWPNNSYYTPSQSEWIYVFGQDSLGCRAQDSLEIILAQASSSIDQQQACGSFSWIDGNTYYSSNNSASYLLSNAAGCDSIVYLQLTIDQLDSTVSQSNDSLFASPNASSYQWIDCNSGLAIPGANNMSFAPSSSGNYAVELALNSCNQTSACYPFTLTTGLESITNNPFRIYPNPAQNELYLRFEQNQQEIQLQLFDLQGRKQEIRCQGHGQDYQLSWENIPLGVYFLQITGAHIQYTEKIQIR
ncbi:T9SS type A sorting domain-containing protein [Saprospira grandis]|uniref:T9SS type A sorting domain-containing protein n=1 Tax=Saprospira grandis TaxID=1008 RepID=UPI0022DD62B0|nr:T9SS type A sorting domain-containing protein [Saprospira grandis]WBM75235.1 T9SS type A sorting domain-containing protein [Saprospira grandis]